MKQVPARLLIGLLLSAPVWAQARVLCWNVHGGREGVPAVIRVLRQSGAELLLLQEAPPKLEEAFPKWSAVRGGSNGELLILGKGLTGRRELRLGRGRPCLLARWQGVTVINVHFSTAVGGRSLSTSGKQVGEYLLHTAGIRREQTDALLLLLSKIKGPMLVAGDFNSSQKMEPPIRLGRGLLRVNTPATFPSAHPAGAIDHFFFSPQLKPATGQIIATRASDHLPIFTTIRPGGRAL